MKNPICLNISLLNQYRKILVMGLRLGSAQVGPGAGLANFWRGQARLFEKEGQQSLSLYEVKISGTITKDVLMLLFHNFFTLSSIRCQYFGVSIYNHGHRN